MKGINFPADKLFDLLLMAVPKTDDIPDEKSLELLIDLEEVLEHIKQQDKVEIFGFLFYVLDNAQLIPHLITSLRSKFKDELTIMKEVNREVGRTTNPEELSRICADRFTMVEKNS